MKASIEKIHWLQNPGKTLAFVDIKIENTIIVKGFKIMDGEKGRWLACPSQKGKDDKWFPSVVFSSKEVQQGFQDHILKLALPGGSAPTQDNAVRPEDINWDA